MVYSTDFYSFLYSSDYIIFSITILGSSCSMYLHVLSNFIINKLRKYMKYNNQIMTRLMTMDYGNCRPIQNL